MSRPSLADQAYANLKNWVVHHRLKPGAQLRVGDLARALQMSPTPVREALSMLEKEQLIAREPRRGFRVSALDLDGVADLYDLRIALEALAARLAAKRLTPSDRRGLSQLLADVERCLEGGDKPRLLDLEQDFHILIFEASRNRPLAEMGRTILGRIWMIQNVNLMTTDHLHQAHPQHLGIFQAIEGGDARRAEILMRRHLAFARQFVLSRLRRKDDLLSHILLGFEDGPVSGPGGERRGVASRRRVCAAGP
ncbi:MAG: GntR family transcriptional regulator [Desulfobacterales bacterium]